jgi:hypothetical protein
VILAVDGGIANCGWSVIGPKGRVVDLGVFLSEPTEGVEKSTDRARRIRDLTKTARRPRHSRYGCTAIAAEQMLFHGKLNAVISQLLPWGAPGDRRVSGPHLYEVPAKTWQKAMLGRKVSYELLEKKLAKFVSGQAESKLWAIPPKKRTHALDSVGVGLFATLAPSVCVIRGKGA